MATRKKTGGRFRLSAAALADSSDDRHSKSFGPSRKGLFYRLNMSDGRVLIMPSVEKRGSNGIELPYYTIGQHWCEVPDDSDNGSHREGKTCWDFMEKEQPLHYARMIKESQYTEETARCFFCHLLETLKDEESGGYVGIPNQVMRIKGRVIETDRPEFALDKVYNMPVIMPQEMYSDDDDHPVKIFPMKITMMKAVMKNTEKYYPDLFDPELNQWVDIALNGKQYGVQVLPAELVKEEGLSLWLDDWQNQIPNLEDQSPNLWTYEEQEKHVRDNHPNIYEVYEARKGGVKVSKPKAQTSRRRTAAKKSTAKAKAKA